MEHIGIIFPIIIVSELLMSWLWVPAYYLHGILVYKKSFSTSVDSLSQINFNEVSSITKRPLSSKMLFHVIDYNYIACREQLIDFTLFSYAPIMHGLIHLDRSSRNIFMKGYLNWSVVFGILMIPYLVFYTDFFVGHEDFLKTSIYFFASVFAFSYFAQWRAYNRIYNAIKNGYGENVDLKMMGSKE